MGLNDASSILMAVKDLLMQYPFVVRDVHIMDGRDEGIYAWKSINYLMETLENTMPIMDLGGGSTQIVFEPDIDLMEWEDLSQVWINHVHSLLNHVFLVF